MALVTQIDNAIKLVDWIKHQLGYPTIQLEIEDPTILENIAFAIQWYQRYSGDIKYRNALIIDLVAGTDTYTLNTDVCSIIDFDTTYSFGNSITTLFTAENVLYNEGLLTTRAPMELVSWELAQGYLDTMRDKLVTKFFVSWNKYKREIKFTPKPTQNLTGVLEVYSYYTHNVKTTIYDEIWIKKYALALTKITLGTIWSKYQGIALPGGGSLNGDSLRAEGIAERDMLETDIIAFESEPLGFTWG